MRTYQKYWWLVVGIPIVALVIIVLRYSVNTPFWDEWELVPIFQHLHAGHFLWHDFWMQHNEHRIFFPNLVLVGLASLTHWNVRVENFISIALAICSFGILAKVVVRSTVNKGQTVNAVLLFLLAMIWFSPVQMENWLWGWQVEWYLNVLGLMFMVYVVATIKDKLSYKKLLLLLAGGILAQYSLGNGTLVWPIVVAILIYKRVVVKQTLLVALTGIAATYLYYYHYVNPAEPSKSLALHKPLEFVAYVFAYLGRPLSFARKPALAIGFVLGVTFVSLSIYLFVKQRKLFDKVLPWIFLGLYAFGSALITGLARLGFGVNEAYSGRYTTISLLFVVSVIMMLWTSREIIHTFIGNSYKILLPLAATGVFCLVIIEGAWGIHSARIQSQKLREVTQCTHQQQSPAASCLLETYPNANVVAPRLQYLKSVHRGGY